MSEEYFLVFYFFVIFGGKFACASKPDCEYVRSEKTYRCRNINDVFPPLYYGNYHLKCDKCNLKTFTYKTFPYPENQLISINLSGSGIYQIGPKAFSSLNHIENLYLDNNIISNISADAFSGLTDIQEVHLENNQLTKIDFGFMNDLHASYVYISFNKITEIADNAFKATKGFMGLDLQYNKIQKLHPDSFSGLGSLEFLDLEYNKLCHLPLGVFKDLPELRHLNLAGNKFTKFNFAMFSGLGRLNSLILANNSVSLFDGRVLLPFQHLTELDISGNAIYYVDANDIFINAPSLRYVYLSDNLFSCDLLANILQFFKAKGIEVNGSGSSRRRFDIQNINGIACIEPAITEPISFKYFLEKAKNESDLLVSYC